MIRIVMENFHDNKHFQLLIGWLNFGKELADWIDVISPVIDHLHKLCKCYNSKFKYFFKLKCKTAWNNASFAWLLSFFLLIDNPHNFHKRIGIWNFYYITRFSINLVNSTIMSSLLFHTWFIFDGVSDDIIAFP